MKKFLPYILMIAVVGVVILGPFGASEAHAWSVLPDVFPSAGDLVLGVLEQVGNFIMWMTSLFLWIAGGLFDMAITVSIVDFSTYANMDGIMTGWKITRDIVNLFFIFIILYIAIATILQLSGYDTKKLLTSVILVALLVNFSAVITKVVIRSSNMLAYEFYDAIKPPKINGQKETLSGVFVSGLKLTTVFKAYDKDYSGEAPIKNQFSHVGIIAGTIGGSILILTAAFVLFAGAIMLIYRAIALLFLIILSPLAFVAMVLPNTKQHADKWWKELFSQSFFAPAYMFMIYLVAKMITSKSLADATNIGSANLLDAIYKGTDLNVIVYFVILIGFMIGGLIVAKSMGAHGSGMVMGWGKKLQGKAQTYAKGVGKRTAGYVPEKILDEKSWINKKTKGSFAKIGSLPFAGKGLAQLSSLRKQEKGRISKEHKKHYDSYSDAGLAAVLKDPLIIGAKRSALEGIQKDREEKNKKKTRMDDLRKFANDTSKDETKRLLAMKLLGELDVETELASAKANLESEKAKSSAAAKAEPAA